MTAGGEVDLVVRDARLLDGAVVSLAVDDGLVRRVVPQDTDLGLAGRSTIDAEGRLVTPSFVNAHMHLDKVHTLPMLGDGALSAYTGAGMGGAMTAIELARQVKASYDRSWIVPNVRRVLHQGVRFGTLQVQAFVDVDTTAGLEGLHAVLAAREELRGVVDVRVVAFPQDGVGRDPGAAELCEEALRLGADVVGGIPWIEHSDREAAAHVEWACALAARTGRRVAMLVDDAGDPALRTTEMLAEAMLRHGLTGRGVACHARATALYARPSLLRLAGLARRAGLAFVTDPHTGPLHLPVRELLDAGVAVAIGQDDVEDAYYPFGRQNMMEVAFLAAHLLDFRSGDDQQRLVEMVTTGAARVLGLSGVGLAPGDRGDLCVHECERVVDLLREHAAPRWVVAGGRVVAETTTRSSLRLQADEPG